MASIVLVRIGFRGTSDDYGPLYGSKSCVSERYLYLRREALDIDSFVFCSLFRDKKESPQILRSISYYGTNPQFFVTLLEKGY